ncbi:aminotransferase class V-fold PLP-dependent enzyme [Helicobacter ailurogastricus]|uniref:Cysteine desulfurase n=1 Tax=Helicobacter ailurogastricus TaxID=1578720 RepID=A0A0K2Y102_9HELI|nr:aminotransferase class V-fold PLP-dependent enzyme [Helicobacter ailurogastricus]BDQ29751.1 cysteine desulfurase [Helicobacter ailurogastricus]CRF52608.1 Cysteine desulfurase [Helicobacter ailurogastricus]
MAKTLLDKEQNKFLEGIFAPLLPEHSKQEQLEHIRQSVVLKKGVRYFDWTASGLASTLVEKRVAKLLPYYANAHSGVSKHARLMDLVYLRCKENIRKFLGLNEDFLVLSAGFGASHAIKRLQEILGIYLPPKSRQRLGDLAHLDLPQVIVGPYEHHSNEVSWREGLCQVVRVGLDKKGLFSLEHFAKLLEEHPKERPLIVSVGAASNVTGLIVPYEQIAKLCQKHNALLAFDLAAYAPHGNLSPVPLDACFVAAHKFLGGVGSCGLLVLKKSLIDTSLPPSFSGGGVVSYVSRSTHEYITDAHLREEVGTYALIPLLRAALALQLRNELGTNFIGRRESMLTKVFMQGLQDIPALNIYGHLQAKRVGNVAFNASGVSCYDLAPLLSHAYGIETRAGCSCAGPYGHDLLGLQDSGFCALKAKGQAPGWLRVSLHYTHSLEDIDHLLDRLQRAVKTLRGG